MLQQFLFNFTHNLFKPLLLFFYMGFAMTLFKVPLEFPKAMYQFLTIYLLISIGWHGGEELASLSMLDLEHASGFMIIGFLTNTLIGLSAYVLLRKTTRLRQIDAATVAGYYGSDSAGTFVTCLGVLTAANLAFASYRPVLLAVMEIPGCLVALFLVSRLRASGKMDVHGNMPGDSPYVPRGAPLPALSLGAAAAADRAEPAGVFTMKVLHEVFLNPGLFLLFGGILIGFISQQQGIRVTESMDKFFVVLFQGVLCLFLLESTGGSRVCWSSSLSTSRRYAIEGLDGSHGDEGLASLSPGNTREVLEGSCTQMTETQTAYGSLLA
jgi:hypothetical protein